MAEFDGHFGAEFDVNPPPFAEAVAWFMDKGIVTQAEFDKLSAAMRVRAFTAAHVYAADGLQTVFDALGAAIKTGSTYREFSQATENILTRAWHRETVFRTNILSAYGGGHWEQAQAAKDLRPYVIYRDAGDGRVRAWHRLGGLVLHIDDPFVRTHWCPWEYN